MLSNGGEGTKEENKGRGREREGPAPLSQIPGSAPECNMHMRLVILLINKYEADEHGGPKSEPL